MNYPPEFIEDCKQAFPEWQELHKALEEGRPVVGTYLGDNVSHSIPIRELKKYTGRISSPAIIGLINRQERINSLYNQWCALYVEANPPKELNLERPEIRGGA